MIKSFDKRLNPFKIGSIPEPCFFWGIGLIIIVGLAVMQPMPISLFLGIVALPIIYLMYIEWINYDDKLVMPLKTAGKRNQKMKVFAVDGYSSNFTYETQIGEHGLLHNDGMVSIMFVWKGVHNSYYSIGQAESEHMRRVALIKNLSSYLNITIEHHVFREADSELIKEYKTEFKKMHADSSPPPIIEDIHNQVCDLYEPLGRSNRVATCISIFPKRKRGIFSLFTPDTLKNYKEGKKLYEELLKIYRKIESDYEGACLLTYQQMAEQVSTMHNTDNLGHKIDYRFNLAEQLIISKPETEDGLLKINDTYLKMGILQNYPSSLAFDWVNIYCEADIDLHVCQIIKPKSDDKVLDKSVKDEQFKSVMMSDKSSVDKTISNMRDAKAYRDYVSKRNIPISDNAYIIAIYSKNKDKVEKLFNDLEKEIKRTEGLLRSDVDIQHELARIRLPGMGGRSTFLRDDHADTIAAMMPFTTFPSGDKKPESLRVSVSGQLVGFRPSELEVAHEMVVAETGGGKDTQFGLRIAETYKRIRYDIIELGNSYQGVIEAIGGTYCRAKEQVINPLASYADYAAAKENKDIKGNSFERMLLISQTDLIAPIFKGFGEKITYTTKEEVVIGAALRYCYENPIQGIKAPTLNIFKEALEKVSVEESIDSTKQELLEELHLFLMTETGSCFKEQDQYIISPVANAIDFSGVEGKLFDYFLNFMCIRLANNAMARGMRSQITLNEYKMLLERAPNPIKHITLTIDRMGRKDCVGLTRITQGAKEIKSVDSEAINSMPNKTLLGRQDQHEEIGQLLKMPSKLQREWKTFKLPEEMKKLNYREALFSNSGSWYHLYLKFPDVLLDLMNTVGADKSLREIAYSKTSDPYERIAILKELQAKREEQKNQETDLI